MRLNKQQQPLEEQNRIDRSVKIYKSTIVGYPKSHTFWRTLPLQQLKHAGCATTIKL